MTTTTIHDGEEVLGPNEVKVQTYMKVGEAYLPLGTAVVRVNMVRHHYGTSLR